MPFDSVQTAQPKDIAVPAPSIDKCPKDRFPTINYIWIGPPSTSVNSRGKHDVAAPMRMAAQNKVNPIKFWCLEEYLSQYQLIFKDHPRVKVCSVEQEIARGLDSKQDDKRIRAGNVKTMQTEVLSLHRNKIRDRACFKEIVSIYLLLEGGYVLDTNIGPLEKAEIVLPEYDRFCIPTTKNATIDSNNLQCNGNYTEVWMLYSPKESIRAKSVFDKYFLRWSKELQTLYEKELKSYIKKELDGLTENITSSADIEKFDLLATKFQYSEYFHLMCGDVFLRSVVEPPIETRNIYYWEFIYLRHEKTCIVPELQMIKCYYSSHHHANVLTTIENSKLSRYHLLSDLELDTECNELKEQPAPGPAPIIKNNTPK